MLAYSVTILDIQDIYVYSVSHIGQTLLGFFSAFLIKRYTFREKLPEGIQEDAAVETKTL